MLTDFDKIDKELKNIENKDIIKVTEIIKKIKSIQGNDKLKSSLKRYQDLKYTVSSTINSSTRSGGSLNSNVKSKRLHPLIKTHKTKRIMKTKTKNGVTTLRRLKNRIKNKKSTIRRGRD